MLRIITAAFILLSLTLPSASVELCGSGKRINCVVDGDTLWWHGEKIRILAMDAPEISKPRCASELALGLRAQRALLDLVNQGSVHISRDGHDRYGRTLASVSAGGRDAAQTLIAAGLARVYVDRRYSWCER